jgi:YHS domain-containing protein
MPSAAHPSRLTRRALLALLGSALLPVAGGAEPPTRLYVENGLALRGHDAVAYFTEGRPVRGSAEFRHVWQGATWQFASAAHRDRFAAEPERYAPAYGGFCAYAVSENYTAPIDPAAWRIEGGRLFLNYDRSVQRRWERDMQDRIRRGDANWPALAQSNR